MDTGSAGKILVITAGILVAYFVARALTQAMLVVFRLPEAAAMVAGMVLFAVFFFGILGILERSLGIVVFGLLQK